jgi:hypothetical protein
VPYYAVGRDAVDRADSLTGVVRAKTDV